jgi:serine protease
MRRSLGSLAIGLTLAFGVAACADIDPAGPEDTGSLTAASQATGRYLVKFVDHAHGMAALHAAGATIIHDLAEHDAAAAHIPEAAVFGLSHNPHIEFIEDDVERYPSAEVTPYGIAMVQATDPTFLQASVQATKVCIIDSGLYNHEDFATLPVTGSAGNLPWNTDGCGHGTHVAGTIAAQAGNDLGVVGVAPEAVALHIVRVFGDDCSWAYSSDLVAALTQCRNAGAKVVSMSLGGARRSKVEENAFTTAWNAGVLSIAAAGNDGNSTYSYPASYSSLISVAAVDSTGTVASFSQFNSEVDIAAPGVDVLSTVPFINTDTLAVNGALYAGAAVENAAHGTVTGALVDGGLCDSVGAWTGKVVLCQRGTISFYDKVHNAQLGGAAGAILYNNVSGGFAGTLGDGYSSTIPAISLSLEDGTAALAGLGMDTTLVSTILKPASGYEAWNGTSMATPHVSGVAALIWSYFPTRTNKQVREALEKSAKDLGTAGRDNYYGNGLVQAKAAYDYLASPPAPVCKASGNACTAASQCCSGMCLKSKCK